MEQVEVGDGAIKMPVIRHNGGCWGFCFVALLFLVLRGYTQRSVGFCLHVTCQHSYNYEDLALLDLPDSRRNILHWSGQVYIQVKLASAVWISLPISADLLEPGVAVVKSYATKLWCGHEGTWLDLTMYHDRKWGPCPHSLWFCWGLSELHTCLLPFLLCPFQASLPVWRTLTWLKCAKVKTEKPTMPLL